MTRLVFTTSVHQCSIALSGDLYMGVEV